MVQYNKKIINNKTIYLIKNKHYGGNVVLNTFWGLDYRIKIVIVLLIAVVVYTILYNFFRLKLNGVIFPIITGYIGYQIYASLMYHTKKLGISLKGNYKKKKSPIKKLIDDIMNILYSVPKIVPIIPKIPEPTFNYQPFKGLREGIRSLQYPYSFDGNNYKLQINFPKVEIPFFDPLAGICCVWEKLKKLIDIVKKAIKVPRDLVKKLFGGIKKVINGIKNNVIKPIINTIKQLIKKTAGVIVNMLYIPIGFLTAISKLPGANSVENEIKKLKDIIQQVQNPSFGGFGGGGKGASNTVYEENEINDYILDYNGPCVFDPIYKGEIFDYEEIYKQKVAKKKIQKMHVFEMYKIQRKRKDNLIRYINAYKDYKFKKFAERQFNKRKQNDYKNKMNKNVYKPHFIYYNTKLHGYSNDKELKEISDAYYEALKYNAHNEKNVQYGGNPFSRLRKALGILKKIGGFFRDLPSKINIICVLVRTITDAIRSIGRKIDSIAKKIFGPIPGFIKKIGKLIGFVGKIVEWFISSIIAKGFRILEAAIELVFNLSLGNLPAAISTKIFAPIKAIFKAILIILKLPFISFFTTIVEILLDIPRFFNVIADGLDLICKIIDGIVRGILNVIKKPFEAMKRAAERAINALKKFGGNNLKLPYTSGLEKLLDKHNYELNIMIQKKLEIQYKNNIDKHYLNKLDNLINDKKKYIKKIKKLLLRHNNIVNTKTTKAIKNIKN